MIFTHRAIRGIPFMLAALFMVLNFSHTHASKGEKNMYGGIDIDSIKTDEEYAALFPDYTVRFTGLVERDVEMSFSDIIKNYSDRIETHTVRGIRTDEETVEIQYTGINLTRLMEGLELKPGVKNVIVYGSDAYSSGLPISSVEDGEVFLVWKKEGAYMVPSQDGVLKTVQKSGLTKKWVKNPVLFDFVAEFIEAVPLKDRLNEDEIDFVSQERLFTLSIHNTPKINADEWTLQISGMVERPQTFSYEDILSMPQESVYAVLETISNPPGGRSIGNAIWTGVPMSHILEQVSPEASVQEIVFKCADGYSTSITLDEALKSGVQLCYRVNGETLLPKHGYPLRLVLPEKYGMKWAMWITEIEFVDYDYKGYWERRGWSDYAGRDRPDQRYD